MACLFWNSWFQNNINVLGQSPVFNELTAGQAPQVVYNVNRHDYNMGYYLANGIYPKWDTSVKTFPKPNNDRKKKFSKYQETYHKDVECCFGILQARFGIIRGATRRWNMATLRTIMIAYIILQNMIVEDERA